MPQLHRDRRARRPEPARLTLARAALAALLIASTGAAQAPPVQGPPLLTLDEALRAVYRCLRPGGRFYLYVPAFPLLFSAMDRKVGHHRRYRLAGLTSQLQRAGFRVLRARYADSLGFFATLLRGKGTYDLDSRFA